MKVALGIKAHSGWAALVVLGTTPAGFHLLDRRRIELVERKDLDWAKQPYHAAEELNSDEASQLVEQAIRLANENALTELRRVVARAASDGIKVNACGVLVGQPMPNWSVAEILAVHFRMHKAEGVMFRDAFVAAAKKCKLGCVTVPEKELLQHAEQKLGLTAKALQKRLACLGQANGPPWAKDQKEATLAAMVALEMEHPQSTPSTRNRN